MQALYAARAQGLPPSPNPPAGAADFITTIGGFSTNQFKEGRLPTLAELDAAVPHHPVYLSAGFVGPSATNTLGKAFFENVPPPTGPVTVGADGSIAASGFGTAGPTGQATLALRQTLTFAQHKQSVRDAMAYAASRGVTTDLDQGAFQATNTPADGAAHEDNFTMHLPFLAVYAEGEQRDAARASEGIIRLRINFLLWDSGPSVPIATQRIQNTFPFFGSDLVRTGAAGEFLADFPHYAGGNDVWMAAALKAASADWRAEVHSITPTDFQTEIQSFEAVNAQVPITDLRWVVAHVPHITEDHANRLKAVGGGVNLTPYQYFNTASPGGPPYRMLLDNGIPVGLSSDGPQIAPMNPWIHAYYATTGLNALGKPDQPRAADHQGGGAGPLHQSQHLVPGRGGREPARLDRGGPAGRRRRAERRLLQRCRQRPEETALATDRTRRHHRALRRNPLLGMTCPEPDTAAGVGIAREHG